MKITPEYQRILDRREERINLRFRKMWLQHETEMLDMQIKAYERSPSLWERARSWWPSRFNETSDRRAA